MSALLGCQGNDCVSQFHPPVCVGVCMCVCVCCVRVVCVCVACALCVCACCVCVRGKGGEAGGMEELKLTRAEYIAAH